MNWFWMNIPLDAAFFLAWTLIPLWMVIKHPDARGRDSHINTVPDPMQAAPPARPAIQPEAARHKPAQGPPVQAPTLTAKPPDPAPAQAPPFAALDQNQADQENRHDQ